MNHVSGVPKKIAGKHFKITANILLCLKILSLVEAYIQQLVLVL